MTQAHRRSTLAGSATLGVSLVAGLCASTSLAAVPTYSTFALQARTGVGLQAGFNLPAESSLQRQTPDIDQAGFVACRVLRPAGDGVFVGPGNATGSLIIDGTTEYSGTLDLDSARGLLALARLGGGAEVRNLQGALVRDFPPGGPENVSSAAGVHLGTGESLLFRGTGGGTQKLLREEFVGNVRTSTRFLQTGGDIASIFIPSSSSGRVACAVNFSDGRAGIVRCGPDAAQSSTIAITGPTYSAIVDGVDINALGSVAFAARRVSDNTFAVFVSDGSTTTTYASVGDLGLIENGFFGQAPALNASNLVAFVARDAAGDAIFVADGTSVARVIGDGDTVQTDLGPRDLGFDSNIDGRQTFAGGISMNDAGQIVFTGVLSDGLEGIFIAQPDPITPACPADLDNGSGTGTRDEAVTIDDLIYFLIAFEAGTLPADLDNGSGTGVRDEAVTIDDLIFFLIHFEAGC